MPYRLDYTHGGTIVLSFRLCGFDLDPASITKGLCITPTKSWKAGDLIGQSPARYQTGCWSLSPSCVATEPLDAQLDLLLAQLEALPPKLFEYITVFEGGITVGVTSIDTNLSIYLDQGIIQRLSRLNLWLDFDSYFVGRKESEANNTDDES